MPTPLPSPTDSGNRWDAKLFQYGLGVIVLGLAGLLLPTFGLQLHRLRALGSSQWIILTIAVMLGSGAVLWSQRRRLPLGFAISGASLVTMLVFSWLSVWRHSPETLRASLDTSKVLSPAGNLPLLEVKFEGSRSREDFLLLCELVKDCVPTAKTSRATYGEGYSSATGKRTNQHFAIGPVPDIKAMMQEIRFGRASWQGSNTLLIEVSYPLPSRSQAFEKRAGHFLGELRSNDPHRQLSAATILATLEPLARREEIAEELMKLLSQPNRPPGVSQCLSRWGTTREVPMILAKMREENANLGELLDVLSVLSPDVAVGEAVQLLPEDARVAERALVVLGKRSELAVLAQAEHADSEVRQAVCRVLNEVGTANSTPALIKLSHDADMAVASVARQALDAIGRRTQ